LPRCHKPEKLYAGTKQRVNMTTDDLYRAWRGFKQTFELSGRLSPTSLHLIFGIVTFTVIYVLLGRSTRAAIVAWLVLLAAQVFNEIIDLYFTVMRAGDIHVRNTIKDFVATLFVPGLALLAIVTGLTTRCKIWIHKFFEKP